MTPREVAEGLAAFACASCPTVYLPRPGACPVCGETAHSLRTISADAVVLAATELSTPAEGWTAPHRIALVELTGGIRVLVEWTSNRLPAPGTPARVESEAGRYRARPAPGVRPES
ncbi:MAG: PhlB family protein [Thermoplasmata archaeon]